MSSNQRLLVYCVDDDANYLDILEDVVRRCGFIPKTFTSPLEAIPAIKRAVEEEHLVLVISDLTMDEMNGFELRSQTIELTKTIPFIILSGHISHSEALKAVDLKINGFLDKTLPDEQIQATIIKETAVRVAELKDDFEMVQSFLEDAETLTEQIEDLLLRLEAEPDSAELVNQIYAIAHTIKGASGFIKPITLHQFMHQYEDVLTPFKKTGSRVSKEAISALLKGLDVIRDLMTSLKNGELTTRPLDELLKVIELQAPTEQEVTTGERAEPTGKKPATEGREEIRVSMKLLDQFMEMSGEITVIRTMINKLLLAIEKELAGNKDVQLLANLLDEMHKINGRMQDQIVELRKISFGSIVRPLPRATRDIASSLKKKIQLDIKCEDLRVDNRIAEVLSNSLIHMVRNSADHGVETPEDRRQNGKPEEGRISLNAVQTGDNIIVTIEDDGKGIDHNTLKAKAVANQLMTSEAAARLSVEDLQMLIFESGISTAKQVTDISGRGVGMDMVKRSVTSIGGDIRIQSTIGQGSRFTLRLPVPKTVNIIGALLVNSAGHEYCIPQDAVYRLLTFASEDLEQNIVHTQGADHLKLENALYPLVSLAQVLKGAPRSTWHTLATEGEKTSIVLVRSQSTIYGLVVDSILDMEDVVVKNLSSLLRKIGIFAGATFLGDGRVATILNPEGIASLCALSSQRGGERVTATDQMHAASEGTLHETVLFSLNLPGSYGIFLENVVRLEKFPTADVQYSGKQPVIVYRDIALPLIDLASELGESADLFERQAEELSTIIIRHGEKLVGFTVERIQDLLAVPPPEPLDGRREGLLGAVALPDRVLTVVDTAAIAERAMLKFRQTPAEPAESDESRAAA